MCFCLRVKFFIPARYFSIRVFSWDIPTPWMFSWDIPTRAQGIYEDNTRGVGYIPGKHPYQTYYRTQYQYGHLTDQRKKVLRMLLNGSMYLLTDQREKVLWMLLNGSMYLERCFS